VISETQDGWRVRSACKPHEGVLVSLRLPFRTQARKSSIRFLPSLPRMAIFPVH
jgi:hypothetical protein